MQRKLQEPDPVKWFEEMRRLEQSGMCTWEDTLEFAEQRTNWEDECKNWIRTLRTQQDMEILDRLCKIQREFLRKFNKQKFRREERTEEPRHKKMKKQRLTRHACGKRGHLGRNCFTKKKPENNSERNTTPGGIKMTTQENTSKGKYWVYIKLEKTEAEMFDDSGADIGIILYELAMKVIQENP